MARPRSLPDSQVYAAVLSLIASEGEKGVTFSAVSQRTGLAGASLVQRYGGLDGMMKAALDWGWTRLEAVTTEAEGGTEDRSAHGLLKAMGDLAPEVPMCALMAASQRDLGLRKRASDWRSRVETTLTARAESGPALFALWMGQGLWEPLGGKSFKLKDAAKRLA